MIVESRWNVDWQGKPKFSEKTCPSATFVHHKIRRPRFTPQENSSGHSTEYKLGKVNNAAAFFVLQLQDRY
jgi:hypothetical protein